MEGLGELHNTLEFIDLNIENIEGKKYFIDSIIRCDIIEKKIRYLNFSFNFSTCITIDY